MARIGSPNWKRTEKQRSGIKSLKVGFNKVFGYYIESYQFQSLPMCRRIISGKQTLANAERFITEELKEWEAKILNASDKLCQSRISAIHRDQGQKWRDRPKGSKEVASVIAHLDCFQSFAAGRYRKGLLPPGSQRPIPDQY